MRWKIIAGLGRLLIAAGALVLLFVAYQLWGTGLSEARSQQRLDAELESLLEEAPSPTSEPPQPEPETATSEEEDPRVAPLPPPEPGAAVGRISIPRIGLEKVFVEGVGVEDLKNGPGHHTGTAFPGESGNAVIGGHRTTYGAPFFRLDELRSGEPIVVTTPTGEHRYVVTESRIVEPTDVWILDPTDDARLTLYTCTPRYSAAQRLVVTAQLETTPTPPPDAAADIGLGAPDRSSDTAPAPPKRQETLTEAPGSPGRVLSYGLVLAALTAAVWLVGRRWNRLLVYVLAAPLVAVALFVFFEQVNALLPSSV